MAASVFLEPLVHSPSLSCTTAGDLFPLLCTDAHHSRSIPYFLFSMS
jgi:hypothetical protein